MGHVVDIHCRTFRERVVDELPRLHLGLGHFGGAKAVERREESLYRARFDGAATDEFLGGNALRFLGFDDAANNNAQRLRARYEEHARHHLPDWLA